MKWHVTAHLISVDGVNVATGLVIGVCASVTAVAAAYKVLWHGKKDPDGKRQPGLLKAVLLDLRGFRDAILGRDPVYDSITRLELSPAIPDIGTRMANQEQQMAVLTEAVAEMVKSNRRIDDLEGRVAALEAAKVERVLSKAEQIQLFSTMETAIKADPSPPDPGRTLP